MNRNLHAESHHHPAVNKGILNSLVTTAEKICDTEHHTQEKRTLNSIFRENGYKSKFINKMLQKKHKETDINKEKTQCCKQVAILPYIEEVTDKISRELKKWKIKTIFSAFGKVQQLIGNIKDPIQNF